MLSHKHRCIFVHVPKVAGISIEQIFLDHLGLDFNNRAALLLGINTNKTVGPARLSHLTAAEYVQQHFVSEELFQNYFKFSFVRNPYDRVFSFYKFLGYAQLVSFETFVLKYLPRIYKDRQRSYFVQSMYNYLYSTDGRLLVDFVGRLESIDKDFKEVLLKLDLPIRPLPHTNNSNDIHLKAKAYRIANIIDRFPSILLDISLGRVSKRKLFTSRMKKVVHELYQLDFEYFSYSV